MKLRCEKFVENIHWKKTGFGGRWKYLSLKKTIIFFDSRIVSKPVRCFDKKGNCWGTIRPFSIEVNKDYSWNGSSSSPDTDWNMLASMIHDFLFQFSGAINFPLEITLRVANNMFYSICSAQGGASMGIMWRIGLFFGSYFLWRTTPRDGEYCVPFNPKEEQI